MKSTSHGSIILSHLVSREVVSLLLVIFSFTLVNAGEPDKTDSLRTGSIHIVEGTLWTDTENTVNIQPVYVKVLNKNEKDGNRKNSSKKELLTKHTFSKTQEIQREQPKLKPRFQLSRSPSPDTSMNLGFSKAYRKAVTPGGHSAKFIVLPAEEKNSIEEILLYGRTVYKIIKRDTKKIAYNNLFSRPPPKFNYLTI